MENLFVKQLLLQGAAGIGVSTLLSKLLENVDAWKNVPSEKKPLYFLLCTIAIAMLSQAILSFAPSDLLMAIDPYVRIIAVALGGWVAGTSLHTATTSAAEIRELRSMTRQLEATNSQLRGLAGISE